MICANLPRRLRQVVCANAPANELLWVGQEPGICIDDEACEGWREWCVANRDVMVGRCIWLGIAEKRPKETKERFEVSADSYTGLMLVD